MRGRANRWSVPLRADLFGDAEERLAYLREVLDRARRFRRLLHRDAPGFGATRYFLIQDRSRDTPHRSVLLEDGGAWPTLFAGDREVESRPDLRGLVTTPGDGHASVSSQLQLSPQELSAMPRPPYYAQGGHFELIHDPATRGYLLEALDAALP